MPAEGQWKNPREGGAGAGDGWPLCDGRSRLINLAIGRCLKFTRGSGM